MRIISGIRKGLKLKSPDGEGTRPTTDRVKESVFNIIQSYIPAGRVLDLFAGSGAMGIEALSRHSGFCVFVEKNRTAFNLIKHNLELSGFDKTSSLVLSDAIAYLKTVEVPFDVIFLDPPYNKGLLSPVLEITATRNLLASNGIIVVETEKGGETFENPFFKTIRQTAYGKTVITVLTRGDV